MANRRADPVSYRPFRANPLLADGLLAVSRDDGALERRVAQGLANMADQFGERADREAAISGERQGAIDAMNAGPGAATVTGGEQVGADGVQVRVAPAQLRTMIADAAVRHGQDPDVLTEIAGLESTFNPRAKNPRSSAGGLFQFVDGTARQYNLSNRFDPAQASDAGARLLADNRVALRNALGREPTGGELYLAHQQGAGGAIKLLSNPNANAAELVGAKAVADNGGSIGMTAGQFAGLWTSKVKAGGGSYAKLPASVADAPVSVTPVRTPVEVTPGRAGGFRPRAGNSIYDRAYNVKGTNTYLQELELTMLQDQASVADAYKDDPVQMEKAMGELLKAHMDEHVFPEIAADYSTAFQKQAFLKVQRAKAEFDQRKEAQDKVDYLGRVDTLEDQKSQTIAGLDPNDENSATVLSNLQSSIDAHYDAGVARGVLTPEEAETYKKKSRSEAVTGFYVGQAGKMKADDIKSMRAEMTKDYAAGELEGVTPDDWERIDKGLAAAESGRRTQDDKADADLAKRGEDIAKRVARGLPVDPSEMSRFQMDASTAPKGKEVVASTLVRLKLAEAIRTQPIGEVEKALSSILGQGATPEDYDFARKAVADQRKELQTDPIGVAERFGILPVSPSLPLDGDVDPDAVSGAFSERINQAAAAAKHFGVSPKFFRPGEAEQIQAAVTADPNKGLAIAAGLVDAAGANSDRVLAELGPAAPAVSLSGGLVAAGGDPKAARDIIAGYGKSPDGKDYPDMPNTRRLPIATTETGGALAFTPGEINRVDAAAAAIARKRLYDAGIDPKKEDAKDIYQRAYQEAAGATFINNVQFGGFGDYDRGTWYKSVKVVVPPEIRADKFVDVVGALTDADIGTVKAKNGKTWTAADYQKAIPVAVKGGYVFALGDPAGSSPMFIADEKGQPVVLDIGGMRDKLQARDPGSVAMNLPDLAQLPQGASDGPETWGEAFNRLATASDETQRVIENVVADDAARYDAYAGYIKEVQDATGVQIANPLDVDLRQGAFEAKPNPNVSGVTGLEWREQKLQASIDKFEADRQRMAAQYPAQSSLIQLDIDGRMKRQMRAAEAEQGRAAQSPELGTIGSFTAQLYGGLKGAARDPYQWAMAVTGGGGSATGTVAAQIGKTMLTEAMINGGLTLVLQGSTQERKRAAGLDHGLDDMLKNAGIAATFGALFGGTVAGGGAIARAYGLGGESAARASRILDGNPERGDVEAMANDLGVTLTEDQTSQISRSFEERVLDEQMLAADATPEQVRVFEAAKRYAEDPDNFPEPELVERAIADEQSGARSLTADDYERLYSGGDPDAIDDIRDTFFAQDDGLGRAVEEPPAAAAAARPTKTDGTSYEIGGGELPDRGVVVANINSDGRIYIGNPGDVHFSLADRYAGDEFGSPEFTGFINADGRIMNREEAFRWVAENEKVVRPSENMGDSLDALDYREQVPDRVKRPAENAPEADPLDGQRIRPDRAAEPADDAALREAEQLAGDISEPRIDANGNPETLLDFVPLQDSDGNIRLVSTREALEAADEENWFADVLEACKI